MVIGFNDDIIVCDDDVLAPNDGTDVSAGW